MLHCTVRELKVCFWFTVSTCHLLLSEKFRRMVYTHLKIERNVYRERCFMKLNKVLCLCVKRKGGRTSVDGFQQKQWNIFTGKWKKAAASSSCSFWSSSIPIKTKARDGCVCERERDKKSESEYIEQVRDYTKGKLCRADLRAREKTSIFFTWETDWLLHEYICYSLIQSYLYSRKVFFHLGTLLTSLWNSLFNSYYDRMKRKSRDAMFFWFSLMMTRTRKKDSLCIEATIYIHKK